MTDLIDELRDYHDHCMATGQEQVADLVGRAMSALTKQQEFRAATEDCLLYGTGIMLNGKRIDPAEVCLYQESQQQEAEPDGYVYEFVSPFSGTPVWRQDSGEWNGQRPKSSRPYFFHPPKPVAQQQEVEPLSEARPGELSSPLVLIDGLGAARKSPEECRDGVSYIQHAGRTYWPLSEQDNRRLLQACCGRGQFDGPQEAEPDAHEIWALSQLAPGEGIEDGVGRILAYPHPPKPAAQPQVPDGYQLVPVEPVITNTMKAECISEFSVQFPEHCHECDEDSRWECKVCDGAGQYMRRVNVPWVVMKDIYKRMYASMLNASKGE